MAFIMIESRTKEIGIRKVNRATNWKVIKMRNLSLIKRGLLSVCLAIPLAWFVMNKWLESCAYKAYPSWWMYIAASIFVALISLIAVSFQSFQSSKDKSSKFGKE